MWKPLKLTSWFAIAIAAWLVGYLYNARYGGELSWLRMMYERKIALAAQVEAPKRLLITGGSGAHYTINAKLMEEKLGIPVLNLGLDGPIGLDVILPSILGQVRKGDIVLLIPEYLILWADDGFGDRSTQFGVAIGKPGLGGIPPKQFAQETFMLGTPTLRAATKSTVDLIEKGKFTGYYSDPVDEHGDPTVTKERTGEWWELPIDKAITPHAVARITEFKKEVEARGGTLVLSLPWVYAKTDNKSVSNVKKTAGELGKIAPLIYDKESLNMQTDSNLFADTHYHLKPEARAIRAAQLVEELKEINELQL
ncbi:hypothetical protein [Limnofasciculus baicalensis]|uniref:Uncharacterized protein n=1 Tax=Limnofasciculus baicalensis BBK-W-15 TaxID=2699891 RepID=A0AAE3KLX4_9CYAN|nr:hypothetical protein [Limnofasciculus baicalensis]MCP2728970.1 hypothetical protein [Limnofasciculus baicalensis BBK-W-15]